MNRMSRNELHMSMAKQVAKRSTCLRKQVGCIIVNPDARPIVTGYNGVAHSVPHCEKCKGPSCGISIHAEEGTITYAARKGIALEGCTLYVTTSPCMNCARMILNAGIKEVFYCEEYREGKPIIYLKNNGVQVHQLIDMGEIPNDER